ncbi:glycosyltransferase family 2 protein [Sphingomonas jatrophae]|uniref:Glycosyl transferase family 2 n=1 Tax=Sphingomonas jatrophae TaxID=1166337 RepID=A0A1I6KYN3_9SPHN|nr:glycosyltransferase family A protein [Sphingomonas jatrophae]SFR96346.1 Glycosyl transferase family 2 [Sphingomonas jatrophae]
MPAVSVIIPAYGVAPYLGEALQSLQAQGHRDWEAIVIDDGDTAAVAAAFAPFADDPRMRLLATSNGGLAAARNRGIAAATADTISLLDGDDLYMPDYLERMLAALAADPEIGFVTCDAILFGLPARDGRRFSEFAAQAEPITLERVLSRTFNVFGSCTIRRSALAQVGYYDEAMRSAEDLDLWVRLLEAGWRAVLVPEPLLRYRRRPDSLSAATLPMLRAEQRLYAAAERRLTGRPEQAAAHAGLCRAEHAIAFEEGEALVLAGRVGEGVRRLREAGPRTRSPSWRALLLGMQLAPWLAPATMRWRIARAARCLSQATMLG